MGKSAPKFKDIDLFDINKKGKRLDTKLARKRTMSAKEKFGAVLESPVNKKIANIKKRNTTEAANASPETVLSNAKLEVAATVKNAIGAIDEKAFDAQGIISKGIPDQADVHDEGEVHSTAMAAKADVVDAAKEAQVQLSLIDITAKITDEPAPDLENNLSKQAEFGKDREIYVNALKEAFITNKEKSYRESLQDDYRKFEMMEPIIQDGERLYAEFKSLRNQLPSKSAIKYQQSLDELMKRNKIIQASGDEITPLKQSVDGLNNLNNKIKEYIARQARKKPQTNRPVLKIVPVNKVPNGEERRRADIDDWLKDNQGGGSDASANEMGTESAAGVEIPSDVKDKAKAEATNQDSKKIESLRKAIQHELNEQENARNLLNTNNKPRIKGILLERIKLHKEKAENLKNELDVLNSKELDSLNIDIKDTFELKKIIKKMGQATVVDKGKIFTGRTDVQNIKVNKQFYLAHNGNGWTRTSPIKKILQCQDGSYIFETETSFYRLKSLGKVNSENQGGSDNNNDETNEDLKQEALKVYRKMWREHILQERANGVPFEQINAPRSKQFKEATGLFGKYFGFGYPMDLEVEKILDEIRAEESDRQAERQSSEERRRGDMNDWLKDNQRTSHDEVFENNTEEPKQKKPEVIDETIIYDEGNMPGASTEDEIYAGYKLDDAERKIEEMKSETRRRVDMEDWLKDNQSASGEASSKTNPEAVVKEINAIEQEFEAMETVDKEKIGVGLNNFGFVLENWKNEKFAKITQSLIPKEKPGKAIQERGTLSRFMHSLQESFQSDASKAEEKILEISDRKKENKNTDLFRHKFANWGKASANIIKYGRTVADFAGVTFVLPLRYVMLGAQAFSQGTDAMKSARLKNEKVIDKTRIEDIDEAAEEAWRIYNQAKGDKDAVSKEELQRAYAKNIPKDLLTRLSQANEPGISSSILEKVFRKDAAGIIKRIDRKISEVENSNRPAEEKEIETQKILTKFKDYLDDYDAVISRYGTVDTLAMAAKYANFAGKTTVNAMMVETLAESVYKLYQKFPEILSYSQNHFGSLFAGASSGDQSEVTPAPRAAGAPSIDAYDKSDYARNEAVPDMAGHGKSALSDQAKTEQIADTPNSQPENASLEKELPKQASDIKAEITNTSGSRLAHFHGNARGGVMEIERGSIEGALKDFLINQKGLDPEAAGQAADEAARDYAAKMNIDFDRLNHIQAGAKISFIVEDGKVSISGLQDDGFDGFEIEKNDNIADIGNEAVPETLNNHPGKIELPIPRQFNSEELDVLKAQKKIIFQNDGLEKIVDYYADHKGLNTNQKDYMRILLERLSDESIHKNRPRMLKAIESALKAYMSLSDKIEA